MDGKLSSYLTGKSVQHLFSVLESLSQSQSHCMPLGYSVAESRLLTVKTKEYYQS